MTRITLFSTITTILFATAADAQVVETASERFTRSAPDAASQMIDTQNFGPSIYGDFDDFNNEVASGGGGTGTGTSEQHSSISPQAYSGTLIVSASANPDFFDVFNGYAESYYEVAFSVSSTIDFNIAGSVNALGAINGESSDANIDIVSISGGTPTLSVVGISNGNDTFDVGGTLLPGDYELRVRTFALVSRVFEDTPGSAMADAQFMMTFDSAPEPILGDLDCSGDVDAGDVGPFVQAMLDPDGYDAAYPDCDKNLADMNQDLILNGDDIATFAAAVLTP